MSRGLAGTRRDDAGFTLVELLISITILGILMAAVTAAMMVGLGTNASTGTRIDESRDQQFTAAYFSADAHGAQTITAGGGAAAPAPTCTFPAGGGVLAVEFVGEDFTDGATPTVTQRTVSYLLRPAADGRTAELHRLVCTGGAANPGPGGDTTLARNLALDSGGNPSDWDASCIKSPPALGCVGVRLRLQSGALGYALTAYRRTT